MLDDHQRGVWNVDADLDHRGRDKYVQFARYELPHHLVLFRALHLSVYQPDLESREDLVAELLVHLRRIPQIDLLRFLDERVNDVDLPAELYFALHSAIDSVPLVLAKYDRLDRSAARRKFVDDRNIEVAVDRHRQRSRYRSRGHYKDVGVVTEFAKSRALQDAETVLLIDHGETEIFKLHRVLDQRVRADNYLHIAGGDRLLRLSFFGNPHAALQ